MSNKRTKQSIQEGSLSHGDEVKPRGNEVSADLLILRRKSERPMFVGELMEVICERNNLQAALKRVCRNKGAPGIDGMTVDGLRKHLKVHWPAIKEELLSGKYRPRPLRRVEIPKSNGRGSRQLSIPCSLDRFIQQAILQILQSKWDPCFSRSSFGFRPGRSAHQAIAQTQGYVQSGYSIVVDIDLESFFDRVHHDRLMSRLAQEIQDKRVLKLMRMYLNVGIMEDGLVRAMTEGVAQGSPISPFLSNIVLDELDKELERRGHRFARYGDDFNIYVKSKRAGDRVMKSVRRFITERLQLKVNEEKSAVDMPQNRSFLGFTFTSIRNGGRRRISPQALKRFRARVRQITRRNRGMSMEKRVEELAKYLRGWRGYFGYCETHSVLRALDGWIRRRLRSAYWKQWKVFKRRRKELMRRGVDIELASLTAWCAKGPWRMSHMPGVQIALDNKYFDALGLPRLWKTNI